MTDLTYNHITARVPGAKHHILINLYGLLYKEITASSLAKVDLEGEIGGGGKALRIPALLLVSSFCL